MLVTNHVLSGAIIGAVVRRPVAAFVCGVGSHFALDAVPHWGVAEGVDFFPVAVRDGLTGLTAMATLWTLSPDSLRWSVLAGMSGAAFPDLDKPGQAFFGRSPFPARVDRFHGSIQREAPHRMTQEFVVGAGLAALALALLRRGAHRVGAQS